jgi:hypothetical protein
MGGEIEKGTHKGAKRLDMTNPNMRDRKALIITEPKYFLLIQQHFIKFYAPRWERTGQVLRRRGPESALVALSFFWDDFRK